MIFIEKSKEKRQIHDWQAKVECHLLS